MKKSALFAPVELSTLKLNMVERLTEAIFTGKIRPGERLNESQLARDMQVSRAPIREALQQLQEQGLVINHPRRGMFVVHLEDEDAQKINSVRLILEAEALRLVRSKLTPAAEVRLVQALERLERSESQPPAVRARLDLEFHQAIWSLTGNEYLEKSLTTLTAPLFANGVLRVVKSERVRHVIYSHRPILDYLLGKKDGSAETVIADHLKVPWGSPDRFSSLALTKA